MRHSQGGNAAQRGMMLLSSGGEIRSFAKLQTLPKFAGSKQVPLLLA
jgi:hypothetical protein